MSTRRGGYASRCKKCLVNVKYCYCSEVIELSQPMPIKVIMHFREQHLTSNTVHLLNNVFDDLEVYKRGTQSDPVWSDVLFDDHYTPLFLFPDDESIELTPEFSQNLEKPPMLIVPDGTWTQAKKFKRRMPELAHIQSVKISEHSGSGYQLRTQVSEHGLSTYEAVAHALKGMGHEKTFEVMLKNFEAMVQAHLKSRGTIKP